MSYNLYCLPEVIIRFARNLPKQSLQNYFNCRFPFLSKNINWDSSQAGIMYSVIEAAKQMEENDLALLHADAERIHEMTDEVGQAALLSVVNDKKTYQVLGNGYDRALWLLLNEYTSFCCAEDIRYTDHHRLGRLWDGFLGSKNLEVKTETEQIEAFKQGVISYFNIGGNIKIELFRYTRNNANNNSEVVQVMLYREGLPDNYLAFDGEEVVPRLMRPVYEMVLIYEPTTGWIEVIAKGREYREELAKLFSISLLQSLIGCERIPLKRYNINKLRSFYDFPTDPEDGIESVKVTMLELKTYDNSSKLTFEVSSKSDSNIYETLNKWFDINDPLSQGVLLNKVKLLVHFFPDKVNPRGITLPIKITWPNGCDLKSKTEKERLIGDKYFLRWGLLEEVDGNKH
ncbi:hypothetical protein I862_07360 [endosymbiont of Acanthamoeba sp. UWC8]|uniref:hypothetical protein n=1 Tax=endosymbiont of Acanthamoeba sp. UWC8 TaxID=86106 RepID=UPI0004D1E511|nr:hypothetical protein [endosymbiont of Acanthamoeba sp. UWC8]AIF82026.1 hypothetical protein I862_07360 [endosymbiont of Acanthamoeba sp. UWC8]